MEIFEENLYSHSHKDQTREFSNALQYILLQFCLNKHFFFLIAT